MRFAYTAIFRLLEVLLVAGLTAMSALVLLNVILRYGFNSNIPSVVEISRFIFVWITFVGAVVALKDNEHLKVDVLVRRLPIALRLVCFLASYGLMFWCCWLLFAGSRIQVAVNMKNYAPISGIPVGLMYAAGLFASLVFALILAVDLVRTLRPSSAFWTGPAGDGDDPQAAPRVPHS